MLAVRSANLDQRPLRLRHYLCLGVLLLVGFGKPMAQDTLSAPLQVVEQMPEYPGGQSAMLQVLYDNLKYPAQARENDITGIVVVGFTIEVDGQLTEFAITKSAAPILDQEALRVVQLLEPFKPGYQYGEPVRVRMNMPITFSLEPTNSVAGDIDIKEWLMAKRRLFDFYLGGGMFFMGENLLSDGGQVDVGLRVGINRYWAGFGYHWRFNRVQEDFELNGTWTNDRSVGMISPFLQIGYEVHRSQGWQISPFVAGVVHWLLPMKPADTDPDGFQAFTVGPKVGLMIDRRFRYRQLRTAALQHQLLRLQISYEPYDFTDDLQGRIISLGLSWGIGQ